MNGILAYLEMSPTDFRRVDANRRYEAEASAVAKQAALEEQQAALEEYLARDFEFRFKIWDAVKRARPPECRKNFDAFKEFARAHGLSFLPATSELAGGYLWHLFVYKRASLDEIDLVRRSITYMHDHGEYFINGTFLDAVMHMIAEADGGDGGGGGEVIPLTPIGNQIISGPDEMPLAAGGA
jgi:hypothetical protein